MSDRAFCHNCGQTLCVCAIVQRLDAEVDPSCLAAPEVEQLLDKLEMHLNAGEELNGLTPGGCTDAVVMLQDLRAALVRAPAPEE